MTDSADMADPLASVELSDSADVLRKPVAFRHDLLRAAALIAASISYSPGIVWAGNEPFITSPVRLIQFAVLAWAALFVVAVVLVRFTNLGSVAGSWLFLLGIMFFGGGAVIDQFGRSGGIAVWALLLIGGCWILSRTRHLRGTRLVLDWAALFLFLTPLAQGVSVGLADDSSTIGSRDVSLESAGGSKADLFVIFLDGYASRATLERDFGVTDLEIADDFERAGLLVPTAAWAPYTMTILSLPSILDLGYPVEAGISVSGAEVSKLTRIISSDNALVKVLKASGYRYSHVESGWYGMNCGAEVDTCKSRPFLDDAMGAVLETSIVRALGVDPYAWSFALGTMKAMTATNEIIQEAVGNNQPDLVISHILAPHPPMTLGPRCERLDEPVGRPLEWLPSEGTWSVEELRTAYSAQIECVNLWLSDLLEIADSGNFQPALLITADHGTGFRGQMERPLESWDDLDIYERLSIMLAIRAPAPCELAGLITPTMAAAELVSCLVGVDVEVDQRHFLVSKASPVSSLDPAELDEIGRAADSIASS